MNCFDIRMQATKLLSLLLIFIFLILSCGKQNLQSEFTRHKVKLKLKFSEGQIFQYDFVQRMKIGTNLFGLNFSVPTVSKFGITNRVTKIDEQGAHIRQRIDYFKQEDKITTLLGKDFAEDIVGLESNFIISPKGKIKYSDDIADMIKLSEANLNYSQILGNTYGFIPAGPVSIGDKWNQKTNFSVPSQSGEVNVIQNVVYTLTGVGNKNNYECLKIDVKGDISISVDLSEDLASDFYHSEGSGELSGAIYFAPKEGRIILSQQTFNLEIVASSHNIDNNALSGAKVKLKNEMIMELREN